MTFIIYLRQPLFLLSFLAFCCYAVYFIFYPSLMLLPVGIMFIYNIFQLNSSNCCKEDLLQKEMTLTHALHHDDLTGLLSRAGYNCLLSSLMGSNETGHSKFALVYVDLDDFKYINDTFGHEIGDKVLIEVGNKLKDLVRQKDYVARLGGDEFVVIIPASHFKDISNVAESVYERVNELSEGFNLNCISHKLTASVGVTIYPDDGPNILNCADEAMYQAKHSGKSKFVFYSKNTSLN